MNPCFILLMALCTCGVLRLGRRQNSV
jgi:hypothetical protein